MLKGLRSRLNEWFSREDGEPPSITERSRLLEISQHYPTAYEFIERKYGVRVDGGDSALTLRDFVDKFGLPPAQILFMEIQMDSRFAEVKSVSARTAKQILDSRPDAKLLDVREEWEMKIGKVPKSEPLTPELLDALLSSEDRVLPIILYCHFGVRSMDAALFLADRGFRNVSVVQGGIEAWSVDVDPTIPRYEAAYC